MSLRTLMFLALALLAGGAFAQSADQQIVSATDSADPVIPGDNFSYTVVIRNNGPNPAVNGGLNISYGSAVTHVSHTLPPGWQCFFNGGFASCITPNFEAGSQATITLVVQMAPHLINFPDGSTQTNFTTSGVTLDPNSGNNSASVTTSWNSPQIDIALSVVDSPEPVGPNQDLTYTATLNNLGPDTATNVNFNVYNAGYVPFKSVTTPAGWICTPPAVGAAMIFTCTAATFASGATSTFTVVARVDPAILGINDGTISTAFGANGIGDDTNDNNSAETENTQYVTPDADMVIAVGDTPDPTLLGDTFAYLVTITNNGPDSATNATMNTYNPGTLRFQMLEAPQAFNCTTPAIGAAPTISCVIPALASQASAEFIVTVRSDAAQLGELGGMVETAFSTGSALADPNNANNSESESTLLRAVNLFKDSFEF